MGSRKVNKSLVPTTWVSSRHGFVGQRKDEEIKVDMKTVHFQSHDRNLSLDIFDKCHW